MPEFDFTEQEIKDVMVVLRGLRGDERDPITGRAVPLPIHNLSEAEKQREKGRQDEGSAPAPSDGAPR